MPSPSYAVAIVPSTLGSWAPFAPSTWRGDGRRGGGDHAINQNERARAACGVGARFHALSSHRHGIGFEHLAQAEDTLARHCVVRRLEWQPREELGRRYHGVDARSAVEDHLAEGERRRLRGDDVRRVARLGVLHDRE